MWHAMRYAMCYATRYATRYAMCYAMCLAMLTITAMLREHAFIPGNNALSNRYQETLEKHKDFHYPSRKIKQNAKTDIS